MELQALLDRAMTHADEGDWPGAAEVLHDHLEDFEDEPSVYCWLGVVETELGRDGVAYDYFKQALALQPEDPYILATAGNGIATFDDPEAMEALKAAALTGPDIALTRLMYGAYLAREGFHEWALEQLEAAVAIDPQDPQISYELGVAKALAGDMDGAADALADASRGEPDDGGSRIVFGLVLLEVGRLDEAVGELAEGARLNPEDVDAQLLASLAAGSAEADGIAYEMLERARMRAAEGDLVLVAAVEDQIDSGAEACALLLREEMAPNALRTRLSARP